MGDHAKKDCRGCSIYDTCEQKGPKKGCIVYPNHKQDQIDRAKAKTSKNRIGIMSLDDEEDL